MRIDNDELSNKTAEAVDVDNVGQLRADHNGLLRKEVSR